MKIIVPCVLLMILFSLLSGIVPCQSKQQDEQFTKTDRIYLYANGMATWFVEKRYLLANASVIGSFFTYWESRKETELQEFQNQTTWLVNIAKIRTGRNMEAKNFDVRIDIEYSQTVFYGLVKYQYDWLGFAKTEGKRILMGDALWWRRHLFLDHAFIVEYPAEYRVINVSPSPDYDKESEKVLRWYGLKTLEVDEPTIIFEERSFTIMDALVENLPLIIGVIALASISFTGLWFYRFRKKEIEVVNPLSTFETKSEEDKVISLLKAAGGNSYQSTITKQCDFSKAKTSMLLTTMENKGIIKRKKQGREKIVTLLKEQ